MKSLSTGLLLLGVIWALLVVWMFLALMGITDPIFAMRVVLYFVVLLLGPLLLIAGPILVLSGRHPKAGAILATVGCIIRKRLVLAVCTVCPLTLKMCRWWKRSWMLGWQSDRVAGAVLQSGV
jgi:hypothetical protein